MHFYTHATMHAMGRNCTLLLSPSNQVIATFTGRNHQQDADAIARWLDELDAKQALQEHAELLRDVGEAGA